MPSQKQLVAFLVLLLSTESVLSARITADKWGGRRREPGSDAESPSPSPSDDLDESDDSSSGSSGGWFRRRRSKSESDEEEKEETEGEGGGEGGAGELPSCKDVAPDTYPGMCHIASTKGACYSQNKTISAGSGGSLAVAVPWACWALDKDSITDDDCKGRLFEYNVSDGHGSYVTGSQRGVISGACKFDAWKVFESKKTEVVPCSSIATVPGACNPEASPGACYSDKAGVTWMCWGKDSPKSMLTDLKKKCHTIPLPGKIDEFYSGSCYWDASLAKDNSEEDSSSLLSLEPALSTDSVSEDEMGRPRCDFFWTSGKQCRGRPGNWIEGGHAIPRRCRRNRLRCERDCADFCQRKANKWGPGCCMGNLNDNTPWCRYLPRSRNPMRMKGGNFFNHKAKFCRGNRRSGRRFSAALLEGEGEDEQQEGDEQGVEEEEEDTDKQDEDSGETEESSLVDADGEDEGEEKEGRDEDEYEDQDADEDEDATDEEGGDGEVEGSGVSEAF